MINTDRDLSLNKLSLNKSKLKISVPQEDTIESVPEQSYSQCATCKTIDTTRQIAASTSIKSSSFFRPKSPINRTFKCPKISRCRLYQWRAIDSIRKTKSSALPASHLACNNWQFRGETASSPDLADTGGRGDNSDVGKFRVERQQRIRLNRTAVCYDNLRWICVFLNTVIMILSFLYFGSALAFTCFKDMLLLTMQLKVYTFLIASFYSMSFVFSAIAISGFYVLWTMSRKLRLHAGLTLLFSILTTSMIFFQNSTQNTVDVNIESQLLSTLSSTHEDLVKNSWDYFQDTFKCCGVAGFLDWCNQGNLYRKINETKEESAYLGTYICSIPSSCCQSYDRENKSQDIHEDQDCKKLLESQKMPTAGCAAYIKKEIYHLGKMYKIMTGGAAVTLMLMTIATTVLFMYFKA